MRMPRANTDALTAWCERHNLNASDIPLEEPERWLDRTGATHYRLRRFVRPEPTRVPVMEPDAEQKWEWVDVITRDEMPPLYLP